MNIILFPGNYPAIQVSSAPFPPVSFAVSVPGSEFDVRCSGPGRFTEAYGRYRKVSEGIGRHQKAVQSCPKPAFPRTHARIFRKTLSRLTVAGRRFLLT